MTNLLTLAERCEAAEAGDQYDLLLEAHLLVRGLNRYVEPGFKSLLNAGAYLDAAMTLVPNDPCIGWEVSDGAGGPTARIWHVGIDRADDWEIGASPLATPALALVAASLRALQHQETGHG